MFVVILLVCAIFAVPPSVLAESSTRVSFFHAFATDGSVMNTLVSQQAAMVESQNDIIIITTLEQEQKDSQGDNSSELKDLMKNYTLIGSDRVAFKSAKWQVAQVASLDGSAWTRLASRDGSTAPDVCAVVVANVGANSSRVVQALDQVATFCQTTDFVLFGTTTSLADEQAKLVMRESAIEANSDQRSLVEVVDFGRLAQNNQMNVSAARNRLFIGSSAAKCLEQSVGATLEPGAVTDVSISMCIGSACTTCAKTEPDASSESNDTSSTETPEPRSSGKGGLIVVLSCGSFLLGCGGVFYVLFRKEFFTPSESTKQEKDLTTNLAYVLRV